MIYILMPLTLFFLLLSCKKETPSQASTPTTSVSQKGSRQLGIHISEPQNGFNSAFSTSQRLSYDVVNLHFFWGVGNFTGTLPGTPLETNTSAGCTGSSTYDMSLIAAATAFYPTYDKKVSLTIGTYDGPNKFVPACATSLAFNHATTKLAFQYLLDNVFATVNTAPMLELSSLIVGNEIDSHSDFSTCSISPLATKWNEYKNFFNHVSAYAKSVKPDLKLGVTGTFDGLTSTAKSPCFQELLTSADFISVTYYPLNPDFTMKSSSVVLSDFAKIVQMYSGKEIRFQEIGYSSGSSYIGSSTSAQVNFYKAIFSAWDAYKDQIKYISIVNLHEWSTSAVDGFGTLYGICPGTYCNNFKEYLQTLGLRTFASDGIDKPAFQTIIKESNDRGWK